MGAKTAAWRGATALAAEQHGLVTTAQLATLGISRRAIVGREQSGWLHRVHQGVYSIGHPGLSREARWMAAVLACLGHRGRNPGEAFLSHRSAATLWGMLPARDGVVDVAIIGEAGRGRHRGVRVHRPRTLETEMTTTVNRIPVTDPARTIVDLRRAKPARGGASPGELRQALRQGAFLRLQLGPGTTDRTRSELERVFLDLCAAHGIPSPEVNVKIGRLTVDFAWREAHVVVETDGFRAHGNKVAFEDDKRRDLQLRDFGYDVVRLTHSQVTKEGRTVVRTLRDLLAAD